MVAEINFFLLLVLHFLLKRKKRKKSNCASNFLSGCQSGNSWPHNNDKCRHEKRQEILQKLVHSLQQHKKRTLSSKGIKEAILLNFYCV
jgi:hypothetical protein